MAASPTPRPTPVDSFGAVAAALQGRHPAFPLAIALSGGADSTALLVASAQAWPGQVQAIHVNHQLHSAADAFEAHCDVLCRARSVPLHVVHVDARHAQGQSPEDAARQARYAALAAVARAQGLATVWLAHQADDQAETLLLALSRGAGLPGLAAMGDRFERHGVLFERPLLAVAASVIRAGLQAQGIVWIDDPTNADEAYTRNRIRLGLLPALAQVFPQFRETFARSARHAAEAQGLLDVLAQGDLSAMDGEPTLTALHALPRARQANLLRHWLRTAHATAPSAVQLGELLDQVDACRTRGHGLRIKVGAGLIERQGARLVFSPPAGSPSV